MRIDRALQIASRARIRRYALPTRTEAPSPSSERDARGRFLQGHVGVSPGRPPRDELREMYIDDLFHSWRYGGRAAIRQLIKQDHTVGPPSRLIRSRTVLTPCKC